MLQFQKDLFGMFFFAQMRSCFVHYDVIYYPSSVNSQYLKMSGIDSPTTSLCYSVSTKYWFCINFYCT